jgi:hypothetical protein
MSKAKQIAPGTAKYDYEGSLGHNDGIGGCTPDELTDLAELATHLAEVCRELELACKQETAA